MYCKVKFLKNVLLLKWKGDFWTFCIHGRFILSADYTIYSILIDSNWLIYQLTNFLNNLEEYLLKITKIFYKVTTLIICFLKICNYLFII